jgi:hypothetical protein
LCESSARAEARQVLDSNDVVLIGDTVGYSALGGVVNVSGYHLAASVAASFTCSKLVYGQRRIGTEEKGAGVHFKNSRSVSPNPSRLHQVQSTTRVSPPLNWRDKRSTSTRPVALTSAGRGLENGVQRAHIVNPGDVVGKDSLRRTEPNTCVYHDEEESPSKETWRWKTGTIFFSESAAARVDGGIFRVRGATVGKLQHVDALLL